MINIDIDKLDTVWETVKKVLKDGIVTGDIWSVESGMTLSGINSNPAMAALFTQITIEMNEALEGSGFAQLNDYYMVRLEGRLLVIILHGDDLVQGMSLDPAKVNIGLLFNVVIPKAIATIKEMR